MRYETCWELGMATGCAGVDHRRKERDTADRDEDWVAAPRNTVGDHSMGDNNPHTGHIDFAYRTYLVVEVQDAAGNLRMAYPVSWAFRVAYAAGHESLQGCCDRGRGSC